MNANDYNKLSIEECRLKLVERDLTITELERKNRELELKITSLTTESGVKKSRCWVVKNGKVVEIGAKNNDK